MNAENKREHKQQAALDAAKEKEAAHADAQEKEAVAKQLALEREIKSLLNYPNYAVSDLEKIRDFVKKTRDTRRVVKAFSPSSY